MTSVCKIFPNSVAVLLSFVCPKAPAHNSTQVAVALCHVVLLGAITAQRRAQVHTATSILHISLCVSFRSLKADRQVFTLTDYYLPVRVSAVCPSGVQCFGGTFKKNNKMLRQTELTQICLA